MARLTRADALLALGDTEDALAAYQTFLEQHKKAGVTRNSALRGEAAALEDLGRYAEAARLHETLAREVSHGNLVAIDLLGAARCLALAGDTERARALYQEVLDDYPDVQTGVDVRVKLLELSDTSSRPGPS